MAGLYHKPLLQIFLYVRNAYDSLDREMCIDILKGYGLGPHMAQILGHYWEKQEIVTKEGKLLGQTFGTEHGVTQGNPESPMLFNIVVDAVIWVVLADVCGPQEEHHRMGRSGGGKETCFLT